jgi:LmbE family N-acetylglucosaminyl deacetylase
MTIVPSHGAEPDRRRLLTRRSFLALLPLSYVAIRVTAASASSLSVLNVVAHEDDDLLFLSPDLLLAVQAGGSVRTIFVTAGDDGQGTSYWQGRENGMLAAYAEMAGVANTWSQADAGVSAHPMPLYTLTGDSSVSLVFMLLPDGNVDGSGFASTGNVSLQDLWTGTISSIKTVDGSSSYTKSSLISTITSLMAGFQPGQIRTQDYVGAYGDGDHSDHHSVAYLTQAAQQQYNTSHAFTGYQDYPDSALPANVSGSNLTAKQNAFYLYAGYDSQVSYCSTASGCAGSNYASWLQRQYTVSAAYAPTANAGPAQTVAVGSVVTLDGSGSTDPSGNPLTYQWTQTGGTAVTLSSSTAAKPTFTAPASPSTLSFHLVVNNGTSNSSPASVSITVVSALPPAANAGPAQTVAVGSVVHLDGSGSTGPSGSTLTYQWTQTGGAAQVTLSSSTAAQPTFTAPASLDGLTFQLVVSDGQASSNPATVAITVASTAAGPDLALSATATASSQNPSTGQTASKAIDGAVGGYPGNYMEEWATVSGGAGSWLKLTWSSPQTIDTIVLYDRPNGSDQITGGNITFSDGSSITVGTLPNSGSASALSFTAKTVTTLQLNITSVSTSTQNVGLAEIQAYLS